MENSNDPIDQSAFATTPGTGSTSGLGGERSDGTPLLESEGRNGVFKTLVKSDDDITGLVAYSVFKQNELDWLTEFRKAKGRDPSEGETDAYIIGESTARRLATYRHLADATLSGRGPEVAGQTRTGRSLAIRSESAVGALAGNSILAYVAIAIVILVGVYLVVRFGALK